MKLYDKLNKFYLNVNDIVSIYKFLAIGGILVHLINFFSDYSFFGFNLKFISLRVACIIIILISYRIVKKSENNRLKNMAVVLMLIWHYIYLFYLYTQIPVFVSGGNEVTLYAMIVPLSLWAIFIIIMFHFGFIAAAAVYANVYPQSHPIDYLVNEFSISISIFVVYFVVHSYRMSLSNKEKKLKDTAYEYKELSTKLIKTQAQLVHDVRSPLTALKLLSENEKQNSLLKIATERVEGIITDIEVKKTQFQPVDVVQVVNYLFEEKKCNGKLIDNRCNPSKLLLKGIDKNLFSRILSNVINNAIEATGCREELITVEFSVDSKYFSVAVQDKGPGVDEAVISSIFDYGFTTKIGGRGLGLSHATEVLTKNNGSIELKNLNGLNVCLRFEVVDV